MRYYFLRYEIGYTTSQQLFKKNFNEILSSFFFLSVTSANSDLSLSA